MGGNTSCTATPECQPVKAILAIQPTRAGRLQHELLARTSSGQLGPLILKPIDLIYGAFRAPRPSKHDPAKPGAQARRHVVKYVQGTGDPWGRWTIVEEFAARRPTPALVRFESAGRYEGYRYVRSTSRTSLRSSASTSDRSFRRVMVARNGFPRAHHDEADAARSSRAPPTRTPADAGLSFEDVTFKSTDGVGSRLVHPRGRPRPGGRVRPRLDVEPARQRRRADHGAGPGRGLHAGDPRPARRRLPRADVRPARPRRERGRPAAADLRAAGGAGLRGRGQLPAQAPGHRHRAHRRDRHLRGRQRRPLRHPGRASRSRRSWRSSPPASPVSTRTSPGPSSARSARRW